MSELIDCLHAVVATVNRVEHENRLINRYTARDFTPFRFLSGWGKVPSTHMLAFFLNPDEDHGQGTLFQELFIRKLRALPTIGPRLPAGAWRVEAERRHADYGQLDLLLTAADGSFGICLENKPRNQTIDQPQQLASYRKLLQQRHHENYLLLYLSREPREPHPNSLSQTDRETLTRTGHYANITYRSFILELLDGWHQAVHPESLRTFLRQFRHHVEQWLQFESTKPAQLMQAQEIASVLSSSVAYVQTAFDINAALNALRTQLLDRLSQDLVRQHTGLTGEIHWKDTGFLDTTRAKPFLIRRISPDNTPQRLPWGRYSIGLEFDQGKLFYGIRFDKANWYQGDTATDEQWPADVPTLFGAQLGTNAKAWSWWPWWEWAGPETDQELYPAIATGRMLDKLTPEIAKLVNILDEHCQVNQPS